MSICVRLKILFLIGIAIFLAFPISANAALAFPGAEGFGRNASGGRGGTVYKVTNLNASGAGSLRECAEGTGARICVFEIGGTIDLSAPTNSNNIIQITDGDITVDGATAPGDGITISGYGLQVWGADNVIIRNIRIRPGPFPRVGAVDFNSPALGILESTNVIIDHVSTAWATSDSWIQDSDNVTIQWSIFSNGLHIVDEGSESALGFGLLNRNTFVNGNMENVSLHHNLFSNFNSRGIKVEGVTPGEVVNNVLYNFKDNTIVDNDDNVNQSSNIDFINNFYKVGWNEQGEDAYEFTINDTNIGDANLYLEGNLGQHRASLSDPESGMIDPGLNGYLTETPNVTNSTITTTTATQAYEDVLSHVGVQTPSQDIVDRGIIRDVRLSTGNLMQDWPEDTPNGDTWPTLDSGTAPTDTDDDGMPDSWEATYGFNSSDATDGTADADGDGYTNLEEYLYDTQPKIISTWNQTNWLYPFGSLLQANWGIQSGFSAASNINFFTENQFTLDTVEKFTNTSFDEDLGTTGWSHEIVLPAAKEPDEIADLTLWFKADAITGLADGEAITTWTDSAGTADASSAVSASSVPTYHTSVINGLPVVRFDADGERFGFTQQSVTDLHLFAVISVADTLSCTIIGNNATTSTVRVGLNDQIIVVDGDSNTETFDENNGTVFPTDGTFVITEASVSSAGVGRVYVDGAKYENDSSSTLDGGFSFQRLGSRIDSNVNTDFSGDIAEVIVFDGVLSDSDKEAVIKYLEEKYAVSAWDRTSAARNTTTKHNHSNLAGSLLVDNTDFDINHYQTVNVGDTKMYNLEAYVYTDGTEVTSSDAQLYYNGNLVSTTYTEDAENDGWYKLAGAVTGAAEDRNYGVLAVDSQALYVDDLSLNRYVDSGTLTSSIYDSGGMSLWGNLSYSVTTPLDSSALVKVRTGNESDLSDAVSFSSCNAVVSGSDISSNSCISDLDRYAQYQVTLTPSSNPHTPTFSSFNMGYGGINTHTDPAASEPAPEVCTNLPPLGKPNLFRITTSGSRATIYFTPVTINNTNYYLSYSKDSFAEEHGAILMLGNEGVQSYTVNFLSPGTTYYFKVRGQNGCATGEWSNIRSVRTYSSLDSLDDKNVKEKADESFNDEKYEEDIKFTPRDFLPASKPKYESTNKRVERRLLYFLLMSGVLAFLIGLYLFRRKKRFKSRPT